jgi:uncharacterized protein
MAMAAAGPDAEFAAALAAGQFRVQACATCERAVFPPRSLCPHCGAGALAFRDVAGSATVYSTTVVHPPQGEAYNVALVDLDAGFRMMSRVEGIAPAAVRIGMRVRARVLPATADQAPLVVFDPA